jgi:hypothetical protein
MAPKKPSGWTMSNDHVSWLAPPESFAAAVTPVAPIPGSAQRPVVLDLCQTIAGRFQNAATPS